MASILKVDELQGIATAGDITVTSEGGAATQSLQQGLAKAWVNMDAGQTVNDSLNTASLTDNATGDHTANWTNALANATYAVATHCRTTTTYMQISTPEGPFTTTTVTINTHQSNSTTKGDKTENGITAHGDLA
jgi:hypothetical protein